MSIERLKDFEAKKAFEFEKKTYCVKSASYKDLKFLIYTDKRTFVFFESEYDEFIDNIKWIDASVSVTAAKGHTAKSHNAEVINVNSRSLRIANKLEEMFNDIATGDMSDEKLKKAAAMVNISNAIVANEVLNLRFIALQNK